jgi:hypothetical protein
MGDMADMINDNWDGSDSWCSGKPNDGNIREGVKYKEIKTSTDKAWLVIFENSPDEWFPKSLCDINEEAKVIRAPRWILQKKGIDW